METPLMDRGSSRQRVPDGEYRALTESAGFRLLTDRLVVKVTGDDRVLFLQGMCSNDVKRLAPDGILYALFLTEHAHVIADCYIWSANEALLIEADRTLWAHTRRHLENLIVADDVEMEESSETAVIDIEGPASSEIATQIAIKIDAAGRPAPADVGLPAPWHYVRAGDLMLASVPRNGAPAFTILAGKARVPEIVAGIGGALEVSADSLDPIRIENGVPKVGVDTDEKTIALEARLNAGISFDKGCYLGQETIERATARGGLKKRLFGLRISGARVPEIGATVMLSGKDVGHVSSVAALPRLGVIALSILHHSAWTPGTAVEIRDRTGQSAAVVSDLPFK
jgi:folate-binding protein YgfZ